MSRSRRSLRQAHLEELLITGRLDASLTQQELAHRLKRPQSFISKYETGERKLSVLEVIEVSQAIGLDPRKIIDELVNVSEA
jgi:transcriptional regulator with XRE-family HTH domain